jgi:hypothetical protein
MKDKSGVKKVSVTKFEYKGKMYDTMDEVYKAERIGLISNVIKPIHKIDLSGNKKESAANLNAFMILRSGAINTLHEIAENPKALDELGKFVRRCKNILKEKKELTK